MSLTLEQAKEWIAEKAKNSLPIETEPEEPRSEFVTLDRLIEVLKTAREHLGCDCPVLLNATLWDGDRDREHSFTIMDDEDDTLVASLYEPMGYPGEPAGPALTINLYG